MVRLFGGLFVAQALLISVNVAGAPDALKLSRDGNVSDWMNTLILLGVAVVCGTLYLLGTRWSRDARDKAHSPRTWLLIAVAFVYFGVDEAAMVHERLSELVFEKVGLWDKMLSGEVTFAAWEALYAPLFAGVALLALTQFWHQRHRNPLALWTGTAAIGIWGLALGMEFLGLTFFWGRWSWLSATIYVEETAELLGSTLFLLAVTMVLRGARGWDRPEAGTGIPEASASLQEAPSHRF